ncbi:MAG TPA: hypothetical protein VGK74_01760 [Symbiobacteriaceae bacterium]
MKAASLLGKAAFCRSVWGCNGATARFTGALLVAASVSSTPTSTGQEMVPQQRNG